MNCPFRIGQGELFGLRQFDDIIDAVAFQCHKTVDYSATREARAGDKPQQCAGLMAVLHRSGQPNGIMKTAYAFGVLDPATLDPRGEAYASIKDARAAHRRFER